MKACTGETSGQPEFFAAINGDKREHKLRLVAHPACMQILPFIFVKRLLGVASPVIIRFG